MKHNNPNITATVVTDSINISGKRLTTLVLVIPRIVVAELNTHRALSRNSASSRAIPFKKMLEQLEAQTFVPTAFQKDHSGMQGTEYFTDEDNKIELSGGGYYSDLQRIKGEWIIARNRAIESAKTLNSLGVTKQLCNRLLEPFLYHKVLITATEWENFLALRAHDQAEIHIQDAAYKILDALNQSKPKLLQPGEYHLPFSDNISDERINQELFQGVMQPGSEVDKEVFNHARIKISVARCARVSYNNFEGKDDYKADEKLYDNLLSSGHMSPFEHIASALSSNEPSGNFKGFLQLRKIIENENRTDKRLKHVINS